MVFYHPLDMRLQELANERYIYVGSLSSKKKKKKHENLFHGLGLWIILSM